jgi:Zn-dependent protease with chaperone function
MLSHKFFHEQAHIEKRHELKRHILLIALSLLAFLIYRYFCHKQEYEADRLAAKKCGKSAALESLELLKAQEKKANFLADFFSLHPKVGKRIERIVENSAIFS